MSQQHIWQWHVDVAEAAASSERWHWTTSFDEFMPRLAELWRWTVNEIAETMPRLGEFWRWTTSIDEFMPRLAEIWRWTVDIIEQIVPEIREYIWRWTTSLAEAVTSTREWTWTTSLVEDIAAQAREVLWSWSSSLAELIVAVAPQPPPAPPAPALPAPALPGDLGEFAELLGVVFDLIVFFAALAYVVHSASQLVNARDLTELILAVVKIALAGIVVTMLLSLALAI